MPNTLQGVEQFVSLGTAIVTAIPGGGPPAAGTVETWTLSASSLPAASNSAIPPTGFYIGDTAAPSEVIAVTNISGATATVIRGADGQTPVLHSTPFTVLQVPAGDTFRKLQSPWLVMPPPSGDTTGVTDAANRAALITQLAGGGGIIMYRPGRYWIAQIPGYTCVEDWGVPQAQLSGVGGTIITAPAGSTQDMWAPSAANISLPGLRYLTFDGGNGSNSAVLVQAHQFNCINVNVQVFRPTFRDLTIVNIPGDGLVAGPGFSVGGDSVSGLRILNCYGNGVNLASSDWHLHDIEVYTPGLNGFLLNGVTIQGSNLKSNKAGARGLSGVPSATNGCCGLALLQSACNIGGGSFMQNDNGTFLFPQAVTYSTPTFTSSGAGFALGTPVVLGGVSGLSAFTSGVVYYVVNPVGATFQLALTAGGSAITGGSAGSATVTPYNGISVYISGSRNRVDVSASGASQCLLYLDGAAANNMIDLQANNAFISTSPNFTYVINNSTVASNRVRIAGNPTTNVAYALLAGGGTEQNNEFTCEEEASGRQSIAFNATITPNPYAGGTIAVGTLTGNITTMNNPSNGHAGSKITFQFQQDATGGRTIAWTGSAWAPISSLPTAPNAVFTISFIFDGTTWREASSALVGKIMAIGFKKSLAPILNVSGVFGTPVALNPATGYAGLAVQWVAYVPSGLVSTETVTLQFVCTYDDNTTQTFTFTSPAFTNTNQNLQANQMASFYKDNHWIKSLTVAAASNLGSTAATVAVALEGAYIQ